MNKNYESIKKLCEAFTDMPGKEVIIPPRECNDVPKFIHDLQLAQQTTLDHSIKF